MAVGVRRGGPALAFALCLVLVAAVPAGGVAGPDGSVRSASDGNTTGSAAPTQANAVTLTQRTTGNVFRTNETVAIDVSTDASAVAWTVTDRNGLRVASGTTAVDGETTLTLAVEERGYYELRAWPAGRPQRATRTAMAVLPAGEFDHDDEFYGMTTQLHAVAGDAAVPLMEAAGVESARVGHDWHEVETSPGEYDFAGAPRANNMGPVAEEDLSRLYMVGYGNTLHTGPKWNSVPNDASARQAYVDYAKAAVGHYDLRMVEVWNEFNRGDFVSGPGAKDPAVYVKLLKATYPAMKSMERNVTVVGGATAVNPEEGQRVDWDFWRGVLKNGGADYMDVQSFHAYREQPTGYARNVQRLRNLTRKHEDGETLPIWVTEFGWSTRLSGRLAVSESTQARYLVVSHVRMKAAGVERAYWFLFQDGTPPQAERNWRQGGLIRHPGDPLGPNTPKPSFVAYATMTRQLAGLEYQRELQTPAAVNGHAYGTGADRVQVLWADPGASATDVTIETTDPVTVTTMTGRTQRLVPRDGEVYLTVGDAPLYVDGETGAVRVGAPVAITGRDGSLEFTVEGAADGPRTVTHAVAGSTVEVTASAGATASKRTPLPSTYRPVRASGDEVIYADGGRRVVDVVRIGGDAVGRLTTGVEPSATSPASVGLGADGTATATPTATPSPTADSGTATRSPSATTTGASGPGFGPSVTAIALAAIALLARRRVR